MITWAIIIGLIFLGLVFIVVEIIFVPGTTIIGIVGGLATGFGIYLAYSNFGNTTGSIVLVCTLIATVILVFVFLKSDVWNKLALKGQIKSKVNEHIELDVEEGDIGVAVSSLKPIGKAEFKDKEYEVKTFGYYVDAGEKVVVIKVENRKIIVEPYKTES